VKTLYIGGIKSGKSKNAERYILENSKQKPCYLATNEFFDEEMRERVQEHKLSRADNFTTIEEPLHIVDVIAHSKTPVLLECVSMWINNMLYHEKPKDIIIKEIEQTLKLPQDIVYIINDVSCSVVSEHKLTRSFVDINGIVAQILASQCENVYMSVAGIEVKIK
jgi:adenosylcobinamide kinase/adenosylcobinamide-phosphate guanylyltransferase